MQKCAIYLRLSKEDKDKLNSGDDSASIVNQRLLLTDYAIEKGYKIYDVYSDDDESGLFDTRPEFERLIKDSKLGKFEIVIAKSQSRFTRNMEHLEKYIHKDFASLGIRFIGVVDGVDSFDQSGKKSRQINGLVNEWYCEDLSQNIRSVFKVKMKDGQFLGSSTPYGYVKDPKNKHHLIIDDEAASVVRRIFQLYIDGNGKGTIAKILTIDGILIPGEYKRRVLGQNYYNPHEVSNSMWSYQTVHTILNNQTYIGNVVQNVRPTFSYKDKRKKKLPEDEWIIVENMHEPIIAKEMYNEAQKLQKVRTRSVRNDKPATIFTGKLFCADCGKAMGTDYKVKRKCDGDGSEAYGFICNTYRTKGKDICTNHSLKIRVLEQVLLQEIRNIAKTISETENLDDLKCCSAKKNTISFEASKTALENDLVKIKSFQLKTYENYMEGIITKEQYMDYSKTYSAREESIKSELLALMCAEEQEQEIDEQFHSWIDAFNKYGEVTELTREMILHLVNKINVFEDHSFSIDFNFKNPYA